MFLNPKSICDRLKHKYVLGKITAWPGLKSACFPVESDISVQFSKYN